MSDNNDGSSMLENTSTCVIRLEDPSFQAKRGPLLLFVMWIVTLVVSFSAGLEGPPVLTEESGGNAFNYSSAVWNITYDPNATTISFHVQPHVYQQFLALRLWLPHPGSGIYEGYSNTDHDVDVEYNQKWQIESYKSNSPKQKGEDKFIEDVNNRKHFSSAIGLDMTAAPIHISRVDCHKNEKWCSPLKVWSVDHIDKDYYFFKLVIHRIPDDMVSGDYFDSHMSPFKVRVMSINPDFTTFELAFKYFFLVVTALVAFMPTYGYVPNLLGSHVKSLSATHFWLLVLLGGLLWFNEPFIGIRVYEKSVDNELTKFSVFTSTIFICLLLYYWLVLLDDCRLRAKIGSVMNPVRSPFNSSTPSAEEAENQVSFACFYIPKMILVFFIWVFMFVTYSTAMTYREADPSFQLYDEGQPSAVLRGLMVTTLVLVFMYILWVLCVMMFVLKKIRALPFNYKWLASLTLFTLLFTIVGMFIGIAYPIPNSSFIFLGFNGMINCYVWVMAIAWCPQPQTHSLLDRDAALELASMADHALEDLDSGAFRQASRGLHSNASPTTLSEFEEGVDEEGEAF